MKRSRVLNNKIQGRVFHDLNNNGIRESSEPGLRNVSIKLYKVTSFEHRKNSEGVIESSAYSEKLLKQVKTDAKGRYSFRVDDGMYSLSLDVNTLPLGKGVLNKNIFIEEVRPENNDFIVRDVDSIEITEGSKKRIHLGQQALIEPALKDSLGNMLSGKVNYKCDTQYGALENGKLNVNVQQYLEKGIDIKVNAGDVSVKVPVKFEMLENNPEQKIRHDLKKGLIDEKEKILSYLYLLFDREKLQTRYRDGFKSPVKSGTTMMEEINEYLEKDDSDAEVKGIVRGYISNSIPNLNKSYKSPSGFFKIHYTTSGKNAVPLKDSNRNGVPDYIEVMGKTFDNVKSVTCDERGFAAPIISRGKDTYDVYVYDLNGVYGMTSSLKIYKDKKGRAKTASSYISIDNNYSESKGFKGKARNDYMRVTVAHEFFHAVQYSYNVKADTWWKEATATWNEDEIYTSINDYLQYIDRILSSPEKSLEESSYGGVIFAKYLSEEWGGYSFIKRIWEIESTAPGSSVRAIDKAIKEKSKVDGIATAFNSFSAYNFNPSQYYKEGDMWEEKIKVQSTYEQYPVSVKSLRLNHLAANYHVFMPYEKNKYNNLKITVQGSDKVKWGFKVQKRKKEDNTCDITYMKIQSSDSRAEVIIYDLPEKYTEICLIPANLEKERDNGIYSYSAELF